MLLDSNVSLEHYIQNGNITLSFKSNTNGYMAIGFNQNTWCPGDIIRVSYGSFPIVEDLNCKTKYGSLMSAQYDLIDGGKNDWHIVGKHKYADKGWMVKITRKLTTKDGERDFQINPEQGLGMIQWAYHKFSSDFNEIPMEVGSSNLDKNAVNNNIDNGMQNPYM